MNPTLPKGKIIFFVSLAVIFLWLLTSLVAIDVGKVGVVTQFGRITGREIDPGLSVKAPWPFQSVTLFDARVQKEQSNVAAASSDLQEIRSTIALNYHLDRGRISEIYQTIGIDFSDKVIAPAIQEAFKATTASYTASDLLTKRTEVKEASKKILEERLGKRGIVVDDMSIVNFDFSAEFNKAIEAKQVAQQEAERAFYKLEQAKKEAEAQAVQKESLTAEILQKQAIEKWDGHMPQYVGGGAVFNIPLAQ
ncbi:MAG TPA: prohibitin family protein [Verrucomicrobiae bacterium]|nr:prohibitin family protein [Verrucomicrobiae bacterium]